MLAEVTTTNLLKHEKPKTFAESKSVAKRGGNVANDAMKRYEEELGQKVISPINANTKELLEVKKDNKEDK